jgi:hypothetical protein
MSDTKYEVLGTDWQNDDAIKCCKNPTDTPPGCDCCYDSWEDELKKVKQDLNKAVEEANQLNEEFKFTSAERDKLKSWFDDLIKADQLARAVCDQLDITSSQTEKICTNSGKTVEAIEILFCMIRDLFEQIDAIVVICTQIENCIKCLNSDELPENSGIRKCLKQFEDKLDAVVKTRNDLIKAIMAVIKMAEVLHAEICSNYGLGEIICQWQVILGCNATSGGSSSSGGGSGSSGTGNCDLVPILTLPISSDPYYSWVKTKYESDVTEANDLAAKLVAANKKKEALLACQSSLIAAIKEVDPKELCK